MSDDDFAKLPIGVQQAIARGDVTLEELEARITAGLGAELCPRCACRPGTNSVSGLCVPCHEKALSDAHREYQSEVLAHQEYNAAKKQSQRVREELDVPLDRGACGRIGLSASWGVRKDGRPMIGAVQV